MYPELTDRDAIKGLLFNVLRAVYRLEQYEVNKFGLTFQQIYLLKFLTQNPAIAISEIANEMRMKLFTATRLADQLETRGLIERKKSSRDRRIVHVTLSKKGRHRINRIDENALDIILENIGRYSEETIKAFFLTSEHFEDILNVEESNGDNE